MLITVTHVNPPPSPMSSIITARGLDEEGNEVTFGGDWRPMRDLADLVEEQGEVQAEIERWQVLSTVPAEPQPEVAPTHYDADAEGLIPFDIPMPRKEDDRG